MEKVKISLLSFFVISLFIFSCGKSVEAPPITSEEYEIYSRLIDSLYITPNRPVVLIGEHTLTYSEDTSGININKIVPPKREYPLDTLINDYQKKNINKYPIDLAKINIPIQKYLTSRQDMFKILNDNYTRLNRDQTINYREKIGIYWFSRIGFNRDRTKALLFVDYLCGAMCGWPSYYLLGKINDRWKIIEELQLENYR